MRTTPRPRRRRRPHRGTDRGSARARGQTPPGTRETRGTHCRLRRVERSRAAGARRRSVRARAPAARHRVRRAPVPRSRRGRDTGAGPGRSRPHPRIPRPRRRSRGRRRRRAPTGCSRRIAPRRDRVDRQVPCVASVNSESSRSNSRAAVGPPFNQTPTNVDAASFPYFRAKAGVP